MALGRAPEPRHDGVRRSQTPLDSRRPSGAASSVPKQSRSVTGCGLPPDRRARSTSGFLALALAACLALLPAAPAVAQSVSVSNITEANGTNLSVTATAHVATAFTTGGTSSDRYLLNSVVLDVLGSGSGDLDVTIHHASGSNPGTKIGAELDDATIGSGGNTTYRAAGITLYGGTTYFVRVQTSGAASRTIRSTLQDTQTGTTGWSIADEGRQSTNSGTSWSTMSGSHVIKFTVNASTVQATSDQATDGWSATLTVDASQKTAGKSGCRDGSSSYESCLARLSSQTFTYGGTTYTVAHINRLVYSGSQALTVKTDPALPSALRSSASFTVGGSSFAYSNAQLFDSNKEALWTNPGFNWTNNQQVSVGISGAGISPVLGLVKNISDHDGGTASTTSNFAAQAFTTGASTSGYSLSSVIVAFHGTNTATATTVRIRTASGTSPNMTAAGLVATLTRSGSGALTEEQTFTAPGGTYLAPSTTYWLTVHEGVATRAALVHETGTSETGQTDWRIANSRLHRASEGSTAWTTATNSAFRIALRGHDSFTTNNLAETRTTAGTLSQATTTFFAPFTTGGATTDSYTLADVVVAVGSNASNLTVGIWNQGSTGCASGVSNCPGTQVGSSLTRQGSAASGDIAFRPSSITLTGATTYYVRLSRGAGSAPTVGRTTSGNETGSTGWTLGNETVNADGSSAWTESLAFWVRAAGRLPAPATVTPTAGNQQVSLTWTAVTGATKYQYRYKVTSAADTTYSAPANITGTDFTNRTKVVTGLSGGTGYTFQVRANDSGLWGSATATPTGAPSSPPTFNRVSIRIIYGDTAEGVQDAPWVINVPLASGTELSATTSTSAVGACATGTTRELGWYKSTALTTRVGTSTTDSLFGRITLAYTPTEAGEYRALAYCKNGTAYSAPRNLMGANGKVTLTAIQTFTVSNLTETEATAGGIPNAATVLFAPFTTGGTSGDSFTLSNATVKVKTLASLVSAEIWSSKTTSCASGVSLCPDSQVGSDLTRQGTDASGDIAFNASSITLTGATTYYVRLTRTGTGTGPTVGRTTSAAQTGSTGWSIGDNVVAANGSAVWGESLLFSVTATRLIAPGSLTATVVGGQVSLGWGTVAGATKYQFRYKVTSAGDATYTTPVDITGADFASRMKSITGLTPGVSYTFQVRADGATGIWASVTATPTTTVYNTDKVDAATDREFMAQGFTTGAHAAGYKLDRAYVAFDDDPNNPSTTTIKVRNSQTTGCGTGVGVCPGDTVLATLARVGSGVLRRTQVFDAPTGTVIQLDAGTTYFLTFNEGISTATDRAWVDATRTLTESGDAGWSIYDGRHLRNSESVAYGVNASFAYQIGIGATQFTYAKPTVTPTAGAEQVSLAWTAVTGATKYQLRYKVTSEADSAWTTPADVSSAEFTARSKVISGLVPGLGYTFQVRANGDTGAWGSATATPTQIDEYVSNLTETRTATDGSLSTSSTVLFASFTTGGASADSVTLDDVVVYVASNATNLTAEIWSSKTTSCATGVSLCPNAKVGTTLTRQGSAASGYIFYAAAANFTLSGATTYYVRLSRAAGSAPTVGRTTSDSQTGSTGWAIGDTVVGSDGSQTWTESLAFLVTAGTSLSAPATVTATAGKDQVTLTWAAVTGASKYQVRYKQTSKADTTYTTPEDTSSTEFTARSKVVTGLLPGVGYTFQVRANGAAGAWGTATATPTTTVYNTDKATTQHSDRYLAQAFTTGANATGYRLDRAYVEFYDHSSNDSKTTTVKVRNSKTIGCGSGITLCPGDTVLATLTQEGSAALRGVQQFNAPAGGVTLDPSTVYFLTINEGVSTGRANVRYTSDTGQAGDAGWGIDDAVYNRTSEGTAYSRGAGSAYKIGISATAYTHAAPANLRAVVQGEQVSLAWNAVTGATRYEYRYKQTGLADGTYISPRNAGTSLGIGITQLAPVPYTFQVRANGSTGRWATVTVTLGTTVYNTTKSRSGSSGDYLAQSFRYGTNTGHGYNLERVYVSFQDASGNDSATTAVKVRNAKTTGCGTGVPSCPGDTVLGTFTHRPSGGQTALRGTHAFDPPAAGVSLVTDTTYFVTVNEGVSTGRAAVDHTVSTLEEGDAAWRIGDYRYSRTSETAMYARALGPFKMGIRASALTAPPAVTAAAGASRVRLTWTAVDGATTYQYRYKQTSMADTAYSAPAEVSSAEINSRNKLIATGLTAGTGYTFQVRANGTSGAWGTATATPTSTVAAPANVRADPGVSSVTLRWDAVGTADYEYRYKLTSAANYGTAVTVSGHLTTSVSIGGLTLDTSYDFQVRSKENTTGGWSTAVTVTTLARADYAGMVTNSGRSTHYLYARGDTYIANAFTTGADASILWNVAIDLYDYNWRCSGRPEAAVWTASGSSPGSLHATLTRAGSGNVFNAPAGAVLSPRTTYFVVFRDANADGYCPVWTKADDAQSGTAGWSIADSYVTKSGNGNWTSSSEGRSLAFTVNRGVPASPPVHAPWNVTAHAEREDGGHLVALSWTHIPGARQYQYRLRAGSDAFTDDGWRFCGGAYNSRTNNWHFRISALEASTTYHFELRGVNPAGHGPSSREVSATTLGTGGGGNQAPVVVPNYPAAPTALTAERGDGEVALSWGPYNHLDNSLAGWEYSSNDGTSWSDTGLGGAATSYTVTGLTNGTAYTFKVRPILGPGTGGASPSATATPERHTTAPDAVANINVTHNGTSLAVTWDAPARATSYNVTYRNGSDGTVARAAWERTGTSLTITCDSRYPGQSQACVVPTASYTVGVQARNFGGTSGWSNSAPAAYDPPPPPERTPERRFPGNDCDLRLTGDGRVSGSWDDSCTSNARRGRFSRYYSFTLASRSLVTIDLKSSTDTYLYLLRGEGRYGDVLHQNDDFDGLNSRIQETLDAGSYTIDATTYGYRARGTFTLDVTGSLAAPADPGGADTAPRFTSAAAFNMAENGTAVATATAADDDPGDSAYPPTFALAGGADQARFSITSAGVLSFSAAPDFENPADVLSTTPADAAGNNVYVLVVQAASGTGSRLKTADQTIRVTVTNANDAPTGAPTFSGTETVGQTLTASTSGIADQDGLTGVTLGLQWVRVDGGSDTDIGSATNATYTLAAADQGKKVKVRVTYTDQGGFTNSVESAESGVIGAAGGTPQAPDAVASISVTHNGTSISASWTAPARATHYDVTYRSHHTGVTGRAAWNQTGTSVTITCDVRPDHLNQNCVESGRNYTVSVRARNAGGESAWTDSPTATQAPDPVASVSVTHNGTNLAASWTAPARATHYDVTYYRHDNQVNARAAWNEAGTSVTITCDSRYPGQNRDCVVATANYTVAVRARNAHGESSWTNSSEVSAGSGPGRVGVSDADAHAAGPLGSVRHLRFAVTLDAPSGREVAVDYATRDGTALESLDYEPGVFGTLRFHPGETSKTVRVLVAQDASVDSCETVLLELSNPRGAAIADGVGVGHIHDGPPPAGTAWLFPPASDPSRRGVVRVVNRSPFPGTVSVTPTDDSGRVYPALALELEAGADRVFDSRDLEAGNPAIGLTGATGPGVGNWRLQFASATLDVQVLPYIHAGPRREGVPPSIAPAGLRREGVPPSIAPQGALSDGFAAPMAATAPADANGVLQVPVFNPADDHGPRSLLRLVNPGPAAVRVAVTGIDDTGRSPGTPVLLALPAGAACTVDAAQLESGAGLACGLRQPGLGNGTGSWRLAVASTAPLVAMNLLSAPDGRLSNLSAAGRLSNLSDAAAPDTDATHRVSLFPTATQPRQGLLRVANPSTHPGTVTLVATDATGTAHPPLTLFLKAGAATTLDANDLELGARAKGLSGSTGPARGPWRLALSADIPFDATTYTSTPDGFLTPTPPTDSRAAASGPGAGPAETAPPVRTCPNPEGVHPTLEPAEAHAP